MSEEYICMSKQEFLTFITAVRVLVKNYEKIEKMIKEELKHMYMKTGFAS
jgi:hypothetical protein